ncbi:MAG: glycosyltransferase family 4 protein [Xanthomonadales bacterium]|nr:glycosyltransferase family 4 protein [Xanthomonadales bacterium]
MSNHYLYATAAGSEWGEIHDPLLADCSERHRLKLAPTQYRLISDAKAALSEPCVGIVIEMIYGWPSRAHLQLARQALRLGRRAFFYWPREEAVEHIDDERLGSYRRLWLLVHTAYLYSNGKTHLKSSLREKIPPGVRDRLRPCYHLARSLTRRIITEKKLSADMFIPHYLERKTTKACNEDLINLVSNAKPVAMQLDFTPTTHVRIEGTGIYLRTDFWAQISSGGSYGHTCFVAKELAALTERFTCYMPYRYTLLDGLGLRQTVMHPPGHQGDELTILRGSRHCHTQLVPILSKNKPAYIYERICLGNYAGAQLSQELGIPYIVEYNGSEISMMRTFSVGGYVHENLYLLAEAAAFQQATVISVISEAVRDDVLKRGIDPRKVLVNPNGADLDIYKPANKEGKAALRRKLGFSDDDQVIAFTGTFGGWHGVDILADAIPEICRQAPEARFLLIGDGNYKHLIDAQVRQHGLESRVHCTGRVPQQEGAYLLGAADIFVSPHNSHMVDSRFFGSPTKLFEYMAMGGGIVASDLEQIGEVLSPAFRAGALPSNVTEVGNERAVLCKPGALDEFVAATLFLVRHPDIAATLGKNAREAVESEYSWVRHVERLWAFVREQDHQNPARTELTLSQP